MHRYIQQLVLQASFLSTHPFEVSTVVLLEIFQATLTLTSMFGLLISVSSCEEPDLEEIILATLGSQPVSFKAVNDNIAGLRKNKSPIMTMGTTNQTK